MSQSTWQQNICFVGAGSMAEALLRGLIDRGIAAPERIAAINRQNESRLNELHQKYRIRTTRSKPERDRWIREADVIVLGMKPKDAGEAIRDIRHLLHPGQLIVSVVAGLPIATIERLIGAPLAIVRTMPNTSSTIGLGATGISFSSSVKPDQRETAFAMFRSVGVAYEVDESRLDIVTGLSGSGPAYVYYLMEAMIAAGVEGGLSEELSRQLTVQTVLGAAQMVKTTNESPEELRRKVTSPNGTTQAAIEVMDAFDFRDGVVRAVLRAAERARELGETIAEQTLFDGKRV